MQPEEISVKVTFLEPYRMVDWSEGERKKNPRTMRGQNYARRKKGQYKGLPFITGTLVRSAAIKAAEEILSLNNGKWNDTPCCHGEFLARKGEKKPAFLRKRHTLQWNNNTSCNANNKCPYCIILGRYDKAGKDHKNNNNAWEEKDYDIHFSNFSPPPEYRKEGLCLKDFTIERTLNRVDFDSGKAQDYFKIYEVDHEILPKHTGTITLNNPCKNAKKLLIDSLRFIDKLCGAFCTIEVSEAEASPSHAHEEQTDTQAPEEDAAPQDDPAIPLNEWAKKMATAFKDADKQEKLRTLADAVRSLRLCPDSLDKLPLGKEYRDKGHHLWDIEAQKIPKKTVRAVLKELWKGYKGKNNDWRRFTETLGNCLYFAYKEGSGGIPVRYRILGEAEYYPDTPESAPEKVADTFIPATPPANNTIKEWIITGRLKAVSPFYFGSFDSAQDDDFDSARDDNFDSACPSVLLRVTEGVTFEGVKGEQSQKDKNVLDTGLTINDQTSFRILLDRKDRYRIPRSVLRGVLRRDLRIAFGSGCDVELGRQVPCNCKVCTEMRKITLMDSVSDFSEPPEIRYRIERNPYTGTVEDGSLFDMEVGPEGITFPFVLRYRGTKFPEELASVIRYWQNDEMAWLGGFGSIGKGRFALVGVKAFEWTLKGEGLDSYISKRGMRCTINGLMKVEEASYPAGLKAFNSLKELANHESYHDNLKPLWTEVSYTIEINSPLLTADTIAALTDSGNRDAIAYRKRVYLDGEKNPPRIQFAVKAETHRGIFRTAIGRRGDVDDLVKDSHEDCTGVLCGIFGNEHEAGNIRFGDLVVENEDISEKHIDHVAIDRFNGGAVDKKKFDTYPLAGSPGKPLKLRGKFWIKKGLSDDYKKMIAAALSDIRDGLYPLGGRGGAGYGWVTKLGPVGVPKEIKDAMRNSTPYTAERTSPTSYEFPKVNVPEWKPDHYYFPYTFLHPHSTVKREKNVVGHEQFHDDLISGKIICKLETLTPLIIPDTDPENVKVVDEHKKYDFFSINGETLIPGSEICGVISAIYESLTNSCFRIFEEERYISRRPKAGKVDAIPGIVKEENGNFTITKNLETVELKKNKTTDVYLYRLPLYDDKDITNNISFDPSNPEYEERKEKIEDAIKWNKTIADVAKNNQDYLKGLSEEERKAVLLGTKEVEFSLEVNERNPNDHLARLVGDDVKDNKIKKGYIKFTGLNTVQINKSSTLKFKKEEYDDFLKEFFNVVKSADIDVKEEGDEVSIDLSNTPEEKIKEIEGFFARIINDDTFSLKTQHNTYEWRSSQKEEYPRPHLWFIKDSVQYNIPKRCERVFLASTNINMTTKEYEISHNVRKQYNGILEDYKKNFDHIEEKFRTKTQNEKLNDGDLVYFIPDRDDKTAAAVFPVPLSRKADDKTLGGRLPHTSLFPCVREKAGDIPADAAKYLDSKLLQLHQEGMCPACRIFGTTFYKGRVRFGFAVLEDSAKWYPENVDSDGFLTLPLLERPKATWPLPENKSKIPGRKFYYHHHGWRDVKGEKKTKNNCSAKALDKGNRFSFEICFENLHPWELGMLLYSLELEQQNNLAHKMGKAKAFGFGSVRITVENIWEMDKDGRWTNSNQKKKDWLETGFKMLEDKEWFNATNWYDVEHVKNLRTILRFPEENEQTWKHQYPKLKTEEENKCDTKGLPGYIELREMLAGISPEIKKKFFTEPGFPWHPFPVDVTIQKTVKEDDKKVYRKERRTDRKHTGIIKSVNRNKGLIDIVKDEEGGIIQGKTSDVHNSGKLESGKKIQYTIAEGLIPLARNIEIID